MDREEFERIKQAEKEHLRELKKLKKGYREALRMKKLRQAMNEIKGAGASGEADEMIERLQQETIENEVRLDMAMEQAEAPAEDMIEQDEAALQAARAAALVRQMKAAMGVIEEPKATTEETEKTIGRMEEDDAEEDEPEAEKTIGRMNEDESETEPEVEEPEPPEKSIGRSQVEAESEEETFPEKTIGRVGRSKKES